jgi:hypothetical protein
MNIPGRGAVLVQALSAKGLQTIDVRQRFQGRALVMDQGRSHSEVHGLYNRKNDVFSLSVWKCL